MCAEHVMRVAVGAVEQGGELGRVAGGAGRGHSTDHGSDGRSQTATYAAGRARYGPAMGTVHETIDDALRRWIAKQHVFFVGTAPLDGGGHVNVSPKGMAGTFAVLDERTCAYLDLTGSGIETVAHVRENGRITLMWAAFDGPPRIVRVQGRGRVLLPGENGWDELAALFEAHRGARSIIVVDADRVSDSCGYSVPKMDFVQDRTRLVEWADNRTDAQLVTYRRTKNATSIDGLPGLG